MTDAGKSTWTDGLLVALRTPASDSSAFLYTYLLVSGISTCGQSPKHAGTLSGHFRWPFSRPRCAFESPHAVPRPYAPRWRLFRSGVSQQHYMSFSTWKITGIVTQHEEGSKLSTWPAEDEARVS